MRWKIPGDAARPIITARQHIESAHAQGGAPNLPENCVLFEMGMALPFMEANFETHVLAENLPCFIASSRCIGVVGMPDVCFVQGGCGAPATVDTMETVRALGVKTVLIAGMCGGFGEHIRVGDIIVPSRVLCEEGASFHYKEEPLRAQPDMPLHEKLKAHFAENGSVLTDATVSCDAFDRQTFMKEQKWREMGCAAVDMEASALLNAAESLGMRAAAAFICSDKHPMRENEEKWAWGDAELSAKKRAFVQEAVAFALAL